MSQVLGAAPGAVEGEMTIPLAVGEKAVDEMVQDKANEEIPMPALEDDGEFDFDPFDGVDGSSPRWFAMALYFSSQRS